MATSKGWTGSTEQCLVSYMETEASDSVFTCKVFKSASLPSIYDPKQDERIINVTTDGAPVHQQVHQAVEYSMVTSVVNQATSVHQHQQQQQHHVWFSEHAARGTPISPDEITRCAPRQHIFKQIYIRNFVFWGPLEGTVLLYQKGLQTERKEFCSVLEKSHIGDFRDFRVRARFEILVQCSTI